MYNAVRELSKNTYFVSANGEEVARGVRVFGHAKSWGFCEIFLSELNLKKLLISKIILS